jgi:predicted NUDIX family NTP pyrophosphohydrolase
MAKPRAVGATAARATTSAGLLLFRRKRTGPEFFLVHMGGPFWARKDESAWTIPKGLVEPGEEPLAAACREFEEETGLLPAGPYIGLPPVRQAGGKLVHAFAVEGDADPARLRSNLFRLEWPPRSGRFQEFAEVDRAAWFDAPIARRKLVKAQAALIDAVTALVEEARTC